MVVVVVVTFGSIAVVEPHSLAVIACVAMLSNEKPSFPNFPNVLPFQGVRLLLLPTCCTSVSEYVYAIRPTFTVSNSVICMLAV